VKSEVFGSTPLTILDDGSPQLVQLTRLPYNGFTNSLLRKRILQWRRMGLDVSEVEPALNATDIEQSYALYAVVEEKVRQAVELDRYITANSGILTASEETSARFRIRQLTGLEELAKIYFVD
jgi:DNA-binding transcriptional MerR regulator